MRLFVSRFFGSVLKLSAAFAACIGCAPKHAETPTPRQIHWHGPETGYTGTTNTKADEKP